MTEVGLRIKSPTGYVETTVTTRLTKVIGSIYLPKADALGSMGSGFTAPASSNGSIYVPDLSGGAPFFFFTAVDQKSMFGILMPSVTISGNTISWTWVNSAVDFHTRYESMGATDRRIGVIGGINLVYGIYS